MAVGGLRLEHVHQDRVADVQLGLGLGIAPVELAVADHALGLGADVDEHLVLVDAHDLARHRRGNHRLHLHRAEHHERIADLLTGGQWSGAGEEERRRSMRRAGRVARDAR